MAGSVARTLDILEVVAARGGASAKDIADQTGLPLPTVYRLVRELLDGDYLVHIKEEKRFELGYKLHALGVSLHEQIGVSRQVRAEVTGLHQQLGVATYLAVHRGSQIVVVFTADSPDCPRLPPLEFGYHEAAHATALGQDPAGQHGRRAAGAAPRPRADAALRPRHHHRPRRAVRRSSTSVARRGIAWEFGEFQDGATCAAAAVRDVSGALVGSVAVSAPNARFAHGRPEVEQALARHGIAGQPLLPDQRREQALAVIACRERCSMIARLGS